MSITNPISPPYPQYIQADVDVGDIVKIEPKHNLFDRQWAEGKTFVVLDLYDKRLKRKTSWMYGNSYYGANPDQLSKVIALQQIGGVRELMLWDADEVCRTVPYSLCGFCHEKIRDNPDDYLHKECDIGAL